jgi:hypothetical protein
MRLQLQSAYRHRNRLRVYHARFNYSHAFAANCNAKQEEIHSFWMGDQRQNSFVNLIGPSRAGCVRYAEPG